MCQCNQQNLWSPTDGQNSKFTTQCSKLELDDHSDHQVFILYDDDDQHDGDDDDDQHVADI